MSELDDAAYAVGGTSWAAIVARVEGGAIPTIYPEDANHIRIRRALTRKGYKIFPPPQVKITGITDTQMERVEDYLAAARESSNKITRRDAKKARTTRTTAVMSLQLAEDFIVYLEDSAEDSVDMAGAGFATTDAEVAFAERSVRRSFDAQIKKVQRAIRGKGLQ